MKVLLVQPNYRLQRETGQPWEINPPLGLCYIAAVLEQNNIPVKIVEANALNLSVDDVVKEARGFDVVGISFMTPAHNFAAKVARSLDKSVLKVAGGPQPTGIPEDVLNDGFDVVVRGEGEMTMLEIAQGGPLEDILGISFKKGGQIVHNKPRPLMTDDEIDALPMPARHLLPSNGVDMPYKSAATKWLPWSPIFATRGCSYNCYFCLPKGTLILKADLTYAPIEELKVNDKIVGVDKQDKKRSKTTITTITETFHRKSTLLKIKTESGEVYSSPDHPWLTAYSRWKRAESLKVGDYLRKISVPTQPPTENEEYMKGYIAGATCGDGSIGHYPFKENKYHGIMHQFRLVGDYEMLDIALKFSHIIGIRGMHEAKFNGGKLYPNVKRCIRTCRKEEVSCIESIISTTNESVSFKKGFMAGFYDAEGTCDGLSLRIANEKSSLLMRVEGYLNSFNFKLVKEKKGFRLRGGTPEIIRFMSTFNPKVTHKKSKVIGHQPHNRTKIISITKIKLESDVYNLETTTQNFIANGFITHNCHKMFGYKTRFRKPESIVKEMAFLKEKYGVKEIDFYDDCFNADLNFAHRVMDSIIDKNLKLHLRFSNGVRINNIDPDILRKFKQAGVDWISFGIESGNQEVLNKIPKAITLDQIRRSVKMTKDAGITVCGFMILGLIGDTRETMQQTIDFAKELNLDLAVFGMLTPYPGSRVWDEIKKNGELLVKNWDDFHHTTAKMTFRHPDVAPPEVVEEMYKKAHKEFYMRPNYILKRAMSIKNIQDVKFMLNGLRSILRIQGSKEKMKR